MVATCHPGARHLRMILNEQQAELPESEVRRLVGVIETYTAPNDFILAPPFYAYITHRRVAGELAENYLWNIKYVNEAFDQFHHGAPEGEGMLKMREIAALLRAREVPLLLLDLNQTGAVPFISSAVEQHYQPIEPRPYRSRNTPLGLYVPKGVPVAHTPLMTEESRP
jgi:hypothetical protein